MTARSYLYVPADQPDKLAKAADRAADALVLDLEDGVAPSRKEAARTNAADFVSSYTASRPTVWVRVNNVPELLAADIEAVVAAGLAGIYLPKATVETVAEASAVLERADAAGKLHLAALIETAGAVLGMHEIAAHPRVAHLAVGEADLGAELGITASADELEWQPIRSDLVVASAVAGIEPPVGSVFVSFQDLDGLRSSTQRLANSGFGGRSAIHPSQVSVINEVFTPTESQVSEARRVVADFQQAMADGRGAVVDHTGDLADVATVRQARRTIEIWENYQSVDD